MDRDIKHLSSVTPNQRDPHARRGVCAAQWITFQTELFARKTLCNIMLDLCTLHRQTQTDIACILFSPGSIGVSEMKQTANISCLLHCRYYAVCTGTARTKYTHFKPNDFYFIFFAHNTEFEFCNWCGIGAAKRHIIQSISLLSDMRDAIRLQLRCYLSLICIWISPHVQVAGSTGQVRGRVPFPHVSVVLTRPTPNNASVAPNCIGNAFLGIWWISISLMAPRDEL